MSIQIRECNINEFEQIKNYIQQFELDNRELNPNQFLVAIEQNTIIGFGRIREHRNCSELCSLGVIEPERYKGIGKGLTKALIAKATQKLYLVCIIPDFFTKLGFEICHNYPAELENKLAYCTSTLIVPETYVAMQYNN